MSAEFSPDPGLGSVSVDPESSPNVMWNMSKDNLACYFFRNIKISRHIYPKRRRSWLSGMLPLSRGIIQYFFPVIHAIDNCNDNVTTIQRFSTADRVM